jgi:nickel/cobalt exporter
MTVTRRIRFLGAAALAPAFAVAFLAAAPTPAAAHPLGNFTINHYAGIRVATDRIVLDVVIDRAEIPTFQERQRIDTDGDGQVSDEEIESERQVACGRLASELSLTEGGQPLALTVQGAGLTFPPGAAGLQTMRLTCEYVAQPATPLAQGTAFGFADRSDTGRIGWREIVVVGDGATISGQVRATGVSERLTAYPTALLSLPLDDRSVTFSATPGGAALPPLCVADAHALVPGTSSEGIGCGPNTTMPEPANQPRRGDVSATSTGAGAASSAAVPGGVGGEISDLLAARDLTPIVLVLSLLAAAALGGFHALTPGHGKTVLAAYLVGTRGTARHALGLGLAVTVSHTIGVALVALLIVAAGNVIPADQYQHAVAVLSGLMIAGIGAWLLAGGIRTVAGRKRDKQDHGPDHDQGHDHNEHDGHAHAHGHSHLPAPGRELRWRALFALGLSGGIVPSTSALIILLATVTSGRAAYGLVLVVAFGVGMAVVLSGVGLALVYTRGIVERAPHRRSLDRVTAALPVLTAVVVFGIGLILTGSALLGRSLTG